MTGLAAAVVEAWQELRIHKLRVLLSLIGVGVAVCSLTTAVAVGGMARQALVEQSEKQDGRPASFGMYAYQESGPTDATVVREAFDQTMDDFDITYHSMVAETFASARLGEKDRQIRLMAVDPQYSDMRRIVPVQGRWLNEADAQNLSPSIVVDPKFMRALGLGPASLPATVTLHADTDVTATIVGQIPKGTSYDDGPYAFILPDVHARIFGRTQPMMDSSYQMWLPPKGAKALAKAVRAHLTTLVPAGYQLDITRQDYQARGDDPYRVFTYVVGGVSALILLLGALSLLNIALVTIKQRVREIGIRRSFGATTGRVFFSVMMESVVATFVAGVIGVVAAIGISKSSFVADHVIDGVTDVPGFPVSAAVLGLAAALVVGALAGLLPALIAVRVKIIDAIRF